MRLRDRLGVPVRARAGTAFSRIRSSGWQIVESTVAATVAWVIAVKVFGHEVAFFAPAAAIIAIGVTRGQRIRRALDVVLGVALGVLVADLLAEALRPHRAVTVLVVTCLGLLGAAVLGAGPIASVQAAVSGVYVAVVTPPGGGVIPSRFVDALIGGAVALVVNQVPLPQAMRERVLPDATAVFARIAEVLEVTATALRSHDASLAERALAQARTLDATVAVFRDAAEADLDVPASTRGDVAGSARCAAPSRPAGSSTWPPGTYGCWPARPSSSPARHARRPNSCPRRSIYWPPVCGRWVLCWTRRDATRDRSESSRRAPSEPPRAFWTRTVPSRSS